MDTSAPETPPLTCDRLIFGGSFDPPHRGHLAILRYALTENLAPQIDLVPAAVSPFKIKSPPTSGEDRRRLLEAALRDLADGADLLAGEATAAAGEATISSESKRETTIDVGRIHLRTLELERPPPSYTADTCRDLQRMHPDDRIGLLIGSDSLQDFERWHRATEIAAQHPVLVFRRTGDSPAAVAARIRELESLLTEQPGQRPEFIALSNPRFPCASSDLRSADSAADRDACLTPRVRELIRKLGLY